MKLSSYIILFLAVFFSYSSHAFEILEASFNDDDLLLPIPDGYCDATDDLAGIFFMDYILKTDDVTNTAPIPIAIFTRCGFENDLDKIYPWGYIGLQNNSSPSISQTTFNEEMSKLLANSRLMDALNAVMEDSIEKKWSEEYGDNESEYNLGEYGVLYSNENTLIFEARNKLLTEGQIMLEDIVASATMLSKTAVYYYIYELENGKTTILENASTLIDNSKLLKRVNRSKLQEEKTKNKADKVQSVLNNTLERTSFGLTDLQRLDLLEAERTAQKLAYENEQYKRLLIQEFQAEKDQERSRVIEDQLITLKSAYVSNIAARVKSFWRYQGAEDDWTCEVYVVQDRDGTVVAADVRNCNFEDSPRGQSFKNSVRRAVYKASPLLIAPDESVFDNEIVFKFTVN